MRSAAPRLTLSLVLVLAVLAAIFAACAGDGDSTGASPPEGSAGSPPQDANSGDGTAGSGGSYFDASGQDGSEGELIELSIDPPSGSVTAVDKQPATRQFQAIAKYKDGHTTVVESAAWTSDLPHIATVDSQGLSTASGDLGGDVAITAVYGGLTANATLKVQLRQTIDLAGVSTAQFAALQTASAPDPSVQMLYPYEGTVFPRGLQPPLPMWNGTLSGDLFLVQFKNAWVDISVVNTAEPPSRFEIPADVWTTVTESGSGSLQASLRRLSGSNATNVGTQNWTIASGSMHGSVYYWSVTWGRVVRIRPGASQPEDFLGAAGVTDGCTTCHTVSADGSTLVMGQGEEQGDSQASTFDLVSNSLVLSGQGRGWANPALSPDGKYLVRNHASLPGYPGLGSGDGMFETKTGAKLPAPTGLEGKFLGMPAFSPDSRLLAFVTVPSPGTLGVFDYDGTTPLLSNERMLVQPGDAPPVQHIAWPTLTPDGKYAVYVRGDRLEQYGLRYPASLYIASTDTGAEARLANLNGDSYPFAAGEADRDCSYEPTMAPIASGGYFWVVFTSRRTYGNILTYGSDPHAIQQLWVAAIDMNPQPGQDPSHAAFWLPGQELATKNMRGFWALDPCKPLDEGCGAASECCSLICETREGGKACGEPSQSQCSPAGGTCTADTDCCGTGYRCINKHCAEPPPA